MPNTPSSWSASDLMDSDKKNLYWRNQRGHLCEVIAAETLIRDGYWVYSTTMLGPIALIAVKSAPPEIRLFDVKAENRRMQKGYMRRIDRTRTPAQKALGVQLVYVDSKTGSVHFSAHKDDEPDQD